MLFVWYTDNFWMVNNTNCSAGDAALRNVVQNSLIFDYYPQLTMEEKAQPNVGNIVCDYINLYCCIQHHLQAKRVFMLYSTDLELLQFLL